MLHYITGKRRGNILLMLLFRSMIFLLALKAYKNPVKAIKAVRLIIRKRVEMTGKKGPARFFLANNRYFFNPNAPGWPSKAFNKFIINELNESLPFRQDQPRLTSLIFSVTKQCRLRCEHCFEWDRLAGTDTLSDADLVLILNKFQTYGISQIQLSGGEPMMRFDSLHLLLNGASRDTDFWLLTSGYNLDVENAEKLRKSGLTGVRISLDHWDKEKHNRFRANSNAFDWVVNAARSCKEADLAMGLALCITNDFLSNENLLRYLELANEMKADFIYLLEPRETGHYTGKDVSISEAKIKIAEDFYLKVNSDAKYINYPQVVFPGYHQRKLGCFGAGIRYLFTDSDGSVHACPFCDGILGDAKYDPIEEIIKKARSRGCHMFRTNGKEGDPEPHKTGIPSLSKFSIEV